METPSSSHSSLYTLAPRKGHAQLGQDCIQCLGAWVRILQPSGPPGGNIKKANKPSWDDLFQEGKAEHSKMAVAWLGPPTPVEHPKREVEQSLTRIIKARRQVSLQGFPTPLILHWDDRKEVEVSEYRSSDHEASARQMRQVAHISWRHAASLRFQEPALWWW